MICTHCKKEILGDLLAVVGTDDEIGHNEDAGHYHLICFRNAFTTDERGSEIVRDLGDIYFMMFTLLDISITIALWVSNDWQILAKP